MPLRYAVPGGSQGILWLTVVLYQAICLARWGRTLGRALLELEVVDVGTGRRPSVARAAARTALLYGPLALLSVLHLGTRQVVDDELSISVGDGTLAAAAIVGVIGALCYASWRRPDKRPFWDRAAGTMARYRRVAPR